MEMNKVNELVVNVETVFNVVDSIPIVAVVGSGIRGQAAIVQFIAAAIFALAGFVGQMVQPQNFTWNVVFQNSCDHMLHGALNYIRGLGEFLLAVTVVGSLALLIYQISSKNGFKPIFTYETPPIAQLQSKTAFN